MGGYHLLGDAAYPISPTLLTPFRDTGRLTSKQKNYNYKLSATRVVIENAFGILKQRIRQLLMLEFNKVDKITKFITCCCVLHNMCILKNDHFDLNNNGPEDELSDQIPNQCVIELASTDKRILGRAKQQLIFNSLPVK